MREKVLVTGATGFVGQALLAELVDLGVSVRAITRGALPQERMPHVEWIRCDLARERDVRRALADVSAAYYLVHSVGQSDHYVEQERRMARIFRDVAERVRLSRIIYLGGVVPQARPSVHLQSRQLAGEILRSGNVPCVELRASMIVGNGSASFRILRDVALRLPVIAVPSWAHFRTMPIAIDDVTTALVCALDVPATSHAWYELPGCDVVSVAQMLKLIHDLRRRRVPTAKLPQLTPRLAAWGLVPVTRVRTPLVKELLNGFSADLLPWGPSFWDAIGLFPQVSYQSAVIEALLREPLQWSLRGVSAMASEAVVHGIGRLLWR